MDPGYRDKDLEAEFLVLRKNELQKSVHGNQPGDKKGGGTQNGNSGQQWTRSKLTKPSKFINKYW
jgi:hypothetical protein